MRNYRNNRVICFGEVLWDMLPGGAKPGGAPMNVAVHLSRLGQDATIVSRIGNDLLGQKLIEFLHVNGTGTQYIETDESLPTSQVLVKLDANRNATYEICEPVAWDNICLNDSARKKIKEAGLIIFGTLAARGNTTRNTLLEILDSGIFKLIDINLRPPFDNRETVEELLFRSDMAKLNNDELKIIGSWHENFSEEKEQIVWMANHYGFDHICVTRGSHGAILYDRGTFYEHPGFRVKTADTVGAGDAFLAALVASLLGNQPNEKSLEFACATGALVASKSGATPDYSIAEIEQILSRE